MSRSNYSDDRDDQNKFNLWRGAVSSAIKGARGQAFLKEMLRAMDALPEHKLISNELEKDGAVCAIGAVGKTRGINMTKIDPTDNETIAKVFGISNALVQEIFYMNDEVGWYWYEETSEQRYLRMQAWVHEQILEPIVG